MEVWLVAFQYTLQGELAHTQHLEVPVHDTLGPRSAVLVFKQPQVQDLTYSEIARGEAVRNGAVWNCDDHPDRQNLKTGFLQVSSLIYDHAGGHWSLIMSGHEKQLQSNLTCVYLVLAPRIVVHFTFCSRRQSFL